MSTRVSMIRILASLSLLALSGLVAAQSTYDCSTLKAAACTHTAGDALSSSTVFFNAPEGNCTGSLLATADGNSNTQLILTSAHCISAREATPPTSFSTTFYYGALGSCVTDNAALASATTVARASRSATVEVVMYDPSRTETAEDGSRVAKGSDTALLRIAAAPPRGAYFAAWDASILPDGVSLEAIGHGRSLQATYMLGSTRSVVSNVDTTTVFGTEGVEVPGHSGSGLYRSTNQLVGVTSNATCIATASPGGVAGPQTDIGRFSTVLSLAKSYLDPNATGVTSATGYYVPAPPDVTFTVQGGASHVGTTGTAVTLAWSASADATSCTASNTWSGTKALSGSETIVVKTGVSTYTLACSNSDGTASKSVTVEGTAPSSSGGGSGGGSSGGVGGSGSGGGSLGVLTLIPMLLLARRKRAAAK